MTLFEFGIAALCIIPAYAYLFMSRKKSQLELCHKQKHKWGKVEMTSWVTTNYQLRTCTHCDWKEYFKEGLWIAFAERNT